MDFTFNGIKESLVKKLKEYSGWNKEILTIGVYSVILDVISFIIEKLVYYVDFRYIETTSNAILRSSVSRMAKDHGYTPTRKSGAIGYLLVGDDESFNTSNKIYEGGTVQILRWFQFKSTDGNIIVYSTKDVRLEKDSIQKTLYPLPGSQTLNLDSGNQTGITIIGHGLSAGDMIYITGTNNLDGVWYLTSNTTPNRLAILRNYQLEIFTGLEPIRSGYAIVPVREGEPKEFIYIAIGELNEKISLFSDSIDQYELEVFLINELGDILQNVEIVSDLYFVNDKYKYTCEIENFPNYDGVWVKFGDDITSRRVRENERYLIKYAITTGSKGNIRSPNIITKSISPFFNTTNGLEMLYITNLDAIIGGNDLQTLLDIKKQYSNIYASTNQLTSRAAWTSAIESFQFVYKAKVWTELDIGNGQISLSGTANQNVHYMTAVNSEGSALTPSQETEISLKSLIPRKSPTDILSWQKLNKIRIKLTTLSEIVNTISFADMEFKLKEELNKQLGVLNLEFKQDLYESNIISIIDNVSGIIRHETNIYYAEEDIEQDQTLKDFIVTKTSSLLKEEDKIIVVINSPEIWIRRKIDNVWYDPIQMSETSNITMSGVNLFDVVGTIVYSASETSQITYQCFDLLENQVPYFITQGTTTIESQIVNVIDVSNIQIGMYVKGLNIQNNSYIVNIDIINNLIILNQPTSSSNEGTGDLTFGWFPDMGGVFGARNPDDSQPLGYILYLIYQTRDGLNNRIGDLRLSKFSQILDFSYELSKFEYLYTK